VDLKLYLEEKRRAVEEALQRYLPAEDQFPPFLHRAIRYSVFAGGKRLRPILAIASCEAVRGDWRRVLPHACALELIHTYSLIHDDLPAMDDDDYRRGLPTSHRVFGEAIAILAGDALLSEAFRLLSSPEAREGLDDSLVLDLIHEIAAASGSEGMVGGQALDVHEEGKEVDVGLLQWIHAHKTGAMITVSVRTGARVGGAREEELEALTRYGKAIGLAFQIVDDILDVEGEEGKLGKRVKKDASKKKATYPGLLGLERAKEEAGRLLGEALSAIEGFGEEADPLREIARYVIERRR